MEVLLDTHALLWYAAGDNQLSQRAKEIIESPDDLCFVSTAALWEIAIKNSLGKLDLTPSYEELIPKLITANNFKLMPIGIDHAAMVAKMGFPDQAHRDPFDRLMIAQAIVEEIPIVSNDRRFSSYPVTRIW